MSQPQFICPKSRIPLVLASEPELRSMNQQIAEHTAFRINGDIVKVPVESGYLRSDNRVFYALTSRVPDLRYYRGIDLSGGALAKEYSATHGNNPTKFIGELDFWTDLRRISPTWRNTHLQNVFLEHFALPIEAVTGRRILDIGCGPLGSLEWADTAAYRVGLDPLSLTYRQLGTSSHRMDYVAADCEAIPYPDGYFDFVSSFNSLDHVDNLELVISEISRITAPGGTFYLISDIHDEPTICEPQAFDWDLAAKFRDFDVVQEEHVEKHLTALYDSLHARKPFDHSNPQKRYGIISLVLRRKGGAATAVSPGSTTTGIYDLLRHEAYPWNDEVLMQVLLRTPRYVREIIFALLSTLIDQPNLSADQSSEILLRIVSDAVLKNYPEGYTNGRSTETAFAEFYLDYAFICHELRNYIHRVSIADAMESSGGQQAEAVREAARRFLLGW